MLTSLLTSLLATTPAVGDVAPDFHVTDTEGRAQNLSTLVKDGPVILAFFPKAFTGGCTRELTAYTGLSSELSNRGARVLAISTDSAETLKKFKAELKAPFAFISDTDAKLAKAYDVKAPILTLAQRYTFVVGPGRKVLSVTSGGDAVDPAGALESCPKRADAGT